MSTRSAIAIPDGDSWKGRYCHSGGYPSWQIPALLGLHQIHGDDLARFLTEEHCSWSGLSSEAGDCHCHQDDGSRTPRQTGAWDGDVEWERWIRPGPDHWDIEWVYVLSERGIFVFIGDGRHDDPPRWSSLAFVSWSTAQGNWTDIECGANFERCTHYCCVHFPDAPEASHRLGTAQYLGREPLDFEDAIACHWRGVRYRLTGSGRLERRNVYGDPDGDGLLGIKTVYGPKWFATVEDASGARIDLHVWSNFKTVPRKLRPGITLVFPPIRDEVPA